MSIHPRNPTSAYVDEARPLRVAVNAVPLLSPLTGIGHYAKALMEAHAASGKTESNYFYATGWHASIRSTPLVLPINRLKQIARFFPKSYEFSRWLQQKNFTKGLRNWKAEVYHEPNFLSFSFDGPTVLTVHDLSWIRHPEAHPVERVRIMNKFFELSLNRATRIITDSDFVKSELIQTFGIRPEHIHAIHLAATGDFKPLDAGETAGLLASRNLAHGQYWVAVGTLEPRKNLQLLLRAFMRLEQRDRQRCPLVIVGMLGWGYDSLLKELERMMASGEVILAGYMPRADQATLLAGAKALIYPSIYEGFGLPLVEAMQSGVPVIAANASCLPEVLGNAGLLIDPYDDAALGSLMASLLSDQSTCDQLAKQSLDRSRSFSWDICAAKTYDVYLEALQA